MRILLVACAMVVIALVAGRGLRFSGPQVVGVNLENGSPQRAATLRSQDVPEQAPAVARTRVESDTVPKWLEELLYGPAGGVAGYTEIVAAIRDGNSERVSSLSAILRELDCDNRGPGRLKNVDLPLALLLGPDEPAPALIAARDAYLEADAATQRHAELMAGVRGWPVSEAIRAKILELLDLLAAATTHADRVAAIEELLRLGAVGAKALVVELVNRCNKDGGGTVPLVHALLDASPDPSVLTLLLHETAATQVSSGQEQASGVVNMIGIGFRTYLANELGSTVDVRRRMAIQSTLMGLARDDAVSHSLGLGVTTAVALGGGKLDDPGVADFLANASRSWPTLAANTALVNLGYAASPQSFLAYVPWPLTPPKDIQRMTRHLDYIAGLTVALNRHPDEVALVLPYIDQTLRTWRSGRYEVLACEDVLRIVETMNIRGASAALQELRMANVPRLSEIAAKILEGWQ
jgi:hypothetical protein